MQIEYSYRFKIVAWYCMLFYLLMLYKWMNGLLLYQLDPFFYYTRQDFVTWLLMQTGLHKWLLNNGVGCISFDVTFYSLPALYFVAYKRNKKLAQVIAMFMLIANFVYVECYTLYPSNSIEGHIAWLLFPVIFIPKNDKTFSTLFEGLRYFFLFFFASAGIWKIAQGGAFHTDEMSGILLFQHKELLANSPGFWQSNLITFLVEHKILSYILYLSTVLLELSFIVGFFTKKFDRLLILGFIFFLLMDHLIMRIPYYEVSPLLLTLWFSKKDNQLH